MWTKVISSLFLLIALTNAHHLSVIGPLVSKNEDTYKAFVVSNEFRNDYDVAVYFSCKDTIARKIYDFKNGSSIAEELTLKINSSMHGACTVGTVMRKKNTNFCYSDSISVISHPNSIVMIQTDKPMYKPNDLVRYQIVAIDDQALPFKLTQVDVEIYDGNDVLVSTTTFTTEITRPDYGFHQSELKLDEDPSLGVWTIRVRVNGEEKDTRKVFGVKPYIRPSFKVFIHAPDRVAYRYNNFMLDISSYSSFGEKVVGKARINITIKDNRSPSKVLALKQLEDRDVNGDEKIEINFKRDLNIKFLIAPVTLIVDVEFEEYDTEIISKASRSISVVPIKLYDYKIIRKPKFIPGLTYQIEVHVEPVTSGKLLTSNELKPMTLSYRFKEQDAEHFGNKTVITSTVEYDGNGAKAKFEIDTTETQEQLRLDFNYDTDELSIAVVADIYNNQNIQILVQEDSTIVGEDFKFTVEASKGFLLSALNVVVMGSLGLIYSKVHPEANEKSKIELTIPITNKMAPEADLVVFYLNEKFGIPVYDTLKIKTQYVCDSDIKIITPYEIQKPGAKVKITVEAKPKTLVSILGIDLALSFLGFGNHISESYFEKILEVDKKTNNLKIGSKHKIFDNIFELSIKENEHICTRFEENLLAEIDQEVEIDKKIDLPKKIDQNKPFLVNNSSGEIWHYDIQEVDESGELTWELTAPNLMTTWMLSGFGMHQEQCLSIASTRRVIVFKD